MSTRDEELARLLGALANGEAAAMTELYSMERGRLQRLFGALSACPSAAEDLVQTTFLDLWTYRGNYRNGCASAYLYRVAVHAWRRHASRAARQRDTLGALTREWSERADDEAGAQLLADEQSRRLQAAIEALPAEQREVFVLHRVEGLSCPRIADSTGANLKTVESRLRLAVRKLAERLLSPEDAT